MAKPEELSKFYTDLEQEIINKAALDETEDFRENIFTQIYIDYLCEAAEIEDGNVCFHEGRGVKVNGYSISEDESNITLFVSIYKNNPSIYSVPPSDAVAMINRAKQFYLKSLKKYQTDIEEAYAALLSLSLFRRACTQGSNPPSAAGSSSLRGRESGGAVQASPPALPLGPHRRCQSGGCLHRLSYPER